MLSAFYLQAYKRKNVFTFISIFIFPVYVYNQLFPNWFYIFIFNYSAYPLEFYFMYNIKNGAGASAADISLSEHAGDQHFCAQYELRQTLGSGTFGVVRLGLDKSSGKKVAVKLIDLKKLDKEKEHRSSSSIATEFRIMKNVDHPNIVKVHDCFDGEKVSYIIME